MGGDLIALVAQTINRYPGWDCIVSEHSDFDILLQQAPPQKIELYGTRLAIEIPICGTEACLITTVVYNEQGYNLSRVMNGSADTVIVMSNQVSWFVQREKLSNYLLFKQGIADPEMAALTRAALPIGNGLYGIEVPYQHLTLICSTSKATEDLIRE
jgi:hypothetical protein